MFVDNESSDLSRLNEYFNKIISAHEDLYLLKTKNDDLIEYENNASLFSKIKLRMVKVVQLFVALLLICYLYYFYVYVKTLFIVIIFFEFLILILHLGN